MGVIRYLILIFLFCFVKCELNATHQNLQRVLPTLTNNSVPVSAPQCVNKFRDLNGKVPIQNITEHCVAKHCIAKCCRGSNRIMYYDALLQKPVKCLEVSIISALTNRNISVDYAAISIYKSNIEQKVQKTNLTVGKDFLFFINKKLSNPNCSSKIEQQPIKNYYILENNSLVMEKPNFYRRFVHYWDMGEFCMEHLVVKTGMEVQGPFQIYRYPESKLNSTEVNNAKNKGSLEEILKSVAMLTSCLCLLLVLFVYGVFRELQNLVGMVLMAYVGTLAVFFFFKAVELLAVNSGAMTSIVCKPMSVFLYYTTLSSFFWMNVMSLDIWWTFRAIFKSRPIHRRGEFVKFMWYALYSWGVPLLVTIAVGVVDYTDLSHLPHIYKPHFEFCFYIKDGVMEMRHYLYIPIFVLLVFDWVFFLMTAFNIWRIRRCMAQFANEANKYNNNQNRFGLYLKLSLVMGVSWVFEIAELPWWLQAVATAYNALIGVAIFFIFVFKRKMLFKLTKRFSIQSPFIEDLQRKYSTSAASNSDRKRSDVEMTSTG